MDFIWLEIASWIFCGTIENCGTVESIAYITLVTQMNNNRQKELILPVRIQVELIGLCRITIEVKSICLIKRVIAL